MIESQIHAFARRPWSCSSNKSWARRHGLRGFTRLFKNTVYAFFTIPSIPAQPPGSTQHITCHPFFLGLDTVLLERQERVLSAWSSATGTVEYHYSHVVQAGNVVAPSSRRGGSWLQCLTTFPVRSGTRFVGIPCLRALTSAHAPQQQSICIAGALHAVAQEIAGSVR